MLNTVNVNRNMFSKYLELHGHKNRRYQSLLPIFNTYTNRNPCKLCLLIITSFTFQIQNTPQLIKVGSNMASNSKADDVEVICHNNLLLNCLFYLTFVIGSI